MDPEGVLLAPHEIDFDLPWARLPGEPREGFPRLNRQNFFLLACREAFRKGSVLPDEEAFLTSLHRSLGLSREEAFGFARLAKQEAEQGKISGPSGLDAKDLFRRGCAFAEAKGKALKEERQLLSSYSEALGVQMMRGDSTLRQLAVKMAKPVTEARPKIGLKREPEPEPAPSWAEAGAISDESLAGLNVMVAPPNPGKPSLPKSPPRRARGAIPETLPLTPEADFQERRRAFFWLILHGLLGVAGATELHRSWISPGASSVLWMLACLAVAVVCLVKATGWLLRLVRPAPSA